MIILFLILTIPGCSFWNGQNGEFIKERMINVISREEGSGTRTAFVDLFSVVKREKEDAIVDNTVRSAEITNSTSIMMGKVASDYYALGYISMGSLNDTVKAISIDGVPPTAENINNGSYTVARPFNIVTKSEISKEARDFIDFILSKQGQEIVAGAGCVGVEAKKEYEGKDRSGKVIVGGSSSVSPVMEKLREAYIKLNPEVTVNLETSDSTTGVNTTQQGICDIGMVSRELEVNEARQGLISTTIAWDGIVVIVNPDNPLINMSKEQVKLAYTGKISTWSAMFE